MEYCSLFFKTLFHALNRLNLILFFKTDGGAELKMSRFRAGVIRYKVYKDHDVLVDKVHFPKGGKMQISPNLDFICTNQDQIRNQRFRLLGNSLYSDRKAGDFFRCSI